MIDFTKFTKYSRPGPRYTSYPTAPEFNTDFTFDDLKEKFKSQSDDRPLSLYIHIPFCRSACYFCGCNVIFTSKEDKKNKIHHIFKKRVKDTCSTFKYK